MFGLTPFGLAPWGLYVEAAAPPSGITLVAGSTVLAVQSATGVASFAYTPVGAGTSIPVAAGTGTIAAAFTLSVAGTSVPVASGTGSVSVDGAGVTLVVGNTSVGVLSGAGSISASCTLQGAATGLPIASGTGSVSANYTLVIAGTSVQPQSPGVSVSTGEAPPVTLLASPTVINVRVSDAVIWFASSAAKRQRIAERRFTEQSVLVYPVRTRIGVFVPTRKP